MNSFDLVLLIMAVVSFLMFLVFYKRLKTSPFWGKVHPRWFWANTQFFVAGPRAGILISKLIRGRHVNSISALMSITVFIVTGIIMMKLASRADIVSLNEKISEDIDNNARKFNSN